MKRVIYILSAFMMFLSCEDEMVVPALDGTGNNGPGVPGEKPSVRPDDVPDEGKNFNFMLYDDESVLLDIDSEVGSVHISFAISQSWDISSDPWITVSEKEKSGYPGNHTVTLYLKKNYTGDVRTGYVTFTSKGGSKKLEVSQKALGRGETANCYIVPKSGTYSFSTVFGNSQKNIEGIAKVEVLWESFGTEEFPYPGDLISDIMYADNTITFKATDRKGNAVIAARNEEGTILWSWHIWLTDQPEDQVYRNNAGTMMDRNLGATSVFPGDVEALGLLYQWGRKDPFLGSLSAVHHKYVPSTIDWPASVESSSIDMIKYSIENPITFIKANYNNLDWYFSTDKSTDNTRWQSTKTIYDPCPAGYRIPDIDVWSIAFGKSSSFEHSVYYEVGQGYYFGPSEVYLTEEDCWYPLAARLNDDGKLTHNGNGSGHCWSCTPNYYDAFNLSFYAGRSVDPVNSLNRANALSVRCQKE